MALIKTANKNTDMPTNINDLVSLFLIFVNVPHTKANSKILNDKLILVANKSLDAKIIYTAKPIQYAKYVLLSLKLYLIRNNETNKSMTILAVILTISIELEYCNL